MSGEVALEAVDLRRSYGGVHAVDGCTFQVPSGHITGLIGPNGAGKSTAVSLLAGSIRPDGGRISLLGRDITRLPNWQRARLGLIRTFQVSRELAHMTVLDNLMMAITPQPGESLWSALVGRPRWRRAEREMLLRAWSLLEQFGLEHMADEYAENLSGGQKRLLEMARAVMPDPKVLLLDEPVAGVNPRLINEIAGHIERLRDQGMTILMVEHELNIVERLCDSVIVMAQGRVLDVGSMDHLRQNQAVVQAYLAG